MDFEAIVNAIKDFFNQPVPIIGITLGSLLMVILTVISKTSFGKKSIRELTKQYNQLSSGFDEVKETTDTKRKELEDWAKEKIEIIQSQYNELCAFIILIAENINNVKIKEAAKSFVEKMRLHEKDFEGFVEKVVNDERNKIVSQYENALLEYKAKLDDLISKMEGQIENGEKEQEINSNTTQE